MNTTTTSRSLQTLIVIGNGMVGHHCVEQLIARGALERYEIHVYGEETRRAYDRVHLSEYLDGRDAESMALGEAALYETPGNLFVAAAKRLVFSEVDIDSIAGPSEILVIGDAGANPAHVAADLLSQAEHDEDAYPLLLTTDRALAAAVADEVQKQLDALPELDSHGRPRRQIAVASVENNGVALVVESDFDNVGVAHRVEDVDFGQRA